MPKVTLFPGDVVADISEYDDLREGLRKQGLKLRSSCGGYASCGECMIRILEGADHINSPSFEEKRLLGNVFHITKERLACQTKVSGDIKIDVSDHPQAKNKKPQTKVRKKEEVREIKDQRQKEREEKIQKSEDWQKHWEKEDHKKNTSGGGRRPRPFRDPDGQD